METYGIGLVGWGTVGGGVLDILNKDGGLLRDRCGLDIAVRAIVTRTPGRARPQDPGTATVSDDLDAILSDPEIRTVLHLVGGTDEAKVIAERCLDAGKDLVTANKALLALHGHELYRRARSQDRCIAFEAAVAGGIPVIAALRDGLVANRIESLHGILNGTCNYILSRMEEEGCPYDTALSAAQELGYAEADPTLDVDGTDTAHKLAILARIAFSGPIDFSAISVEGIEAISADDIASAKRLGCRIKLLGVVVQREEGLELRVAPTLVPLDHPLANVGANYNAVQIEAHAAGPTLLVGQGAGALPTASAVVADLVDIATGAYADTADRFTFFSAERPVRILDESEELTGSYARLTVPDRVGVLNGIATTFAERGISIRSLHQDERSSDSVATIEATTHPCSGGAFLDAIKALDGSELTLMPSTILRLLG